MPKKKASKETVIFVYGGAMSAFQSKVIEESKKSFNIVDDSKNADYIVIGRGLPDQGVKSVDFAEFGESLGVFPDEKKRITSTVMDADSTNEEE